MLLRLRIRVIQEITDIPELIAESWTQAGEGHVDMLTVFLTLSDFSLIFSHRKCSRNEVRAARIAPLGSEGYLSFEAMSALASETGRHFRRSDEQARLGVLLSDVLRKARAEASDHSVGLAVSEPRGVEELSWDKLILVADDCEQCCGSSRGERGAFVFGVGPLRHWYRGRRGS